MTTNENDHHAHECPTCFSVYQCGAPIETVGRRRRCVIARPCPTCTATGHRTGPCPSCGADSECHCTAPSCLFAGKLCDTCQLAHLDAQPA